jgi:DMSO/TMAO reductase YedYZ molybdopterin-dependent catalytic subunit
MKKPKGMDSGLEDFSRREIASVERRFFMKRSLSVGALALLSGCDVTNQESVQKVLWAMSRWNDRVQDWIFDPARLAPEFPESRITRPFPFNAFYGVAEAPVVEPSTYKLEVSGLVRETTPWTLPELYKLPETSQVTRHICVEGWSAIGKWSGVRFSDFLARIGADTTARYVGFKCADDYYTSIDMATALHPQTVLSFRFGDALLPREYGFPMKLRMPTKLGFKNPKHITALFVTNAYPGGYWEDQGYNWYSGS